MKTHLTSRAPLGKFEMGRTLCGHTVTGHDIAAKGEDPTCLRCLKYKNKQKRPTCPHCQSTDLDLGATGLDLCKACGGLSRGGKTLREAGDYNV